MFCFFVRNKLHLISDKFIKNIIFIKIRFEKGFECGQLEFFTIWLTINKPILRISFVSALSKIFFNNFIRNKNELFRHRYIRHVVSFMIARKKEFANEIEVFVKINMEENKSRQSIFYNISAEFFGINNFLSIFIKKFVVCVVTYGTIKTLVGMI